MHKNQLIKNSSIKPPYRVRCVVVRSMAERRIPMPGFQEEEGFLLTIPNSRERGVDFLYREVRWLLGPRDLGVTHHALLLP